MILKFITGAVRLVVGAVTGCHERELLFHSHEFNGDPSPVAGVGVFSMVRRGVAICVDLAVRKHWQEWRYSVND